jgi:high-affinity nickel permease
LNVLDQSLAHLAPGAPMLVVVGIAVVLGLRHASDPDHLVAVTSLIAGGGEGRLRRAGLLGLVWGVGHATSLAAVGLPIILFQRVLPESFRQAAEVAIGLMIVALAVRLLRRWKRGAFDAHAHARRLPAGTRSPAFAYGIGILHGLGGSAGVTVLLLAMVRDEVVAAACLLVFAACTALSMAMLSTAFGYLLVRTRGLALARVAPILGSASLAFGAWYVLGAAGAIAFPF